MMNFRCKSHNRRSASNKTRAIFLWNITKALIKQRLKFFQINMPLYILNYLQNVVSNSIISTDKFKSYSKLGIFIKPSVINTNS
ncbi:hypothetical protein H311_02278 [Anncaliia algerae PRA109]|nr:hypothetical protein H311_02278 [Anncaliia algerae PRA109]